MAYVPDSTVPSPTEYLGHIVGAPGELTRAAEVYGYYRALAAASDRVKVDHRQERGGARDPARVDRRRAEPGATSSRAASAAGLADPRTTARGGAPIGREGKAFYMLHGGLHSPETGSPEMLMELAYRLAVSERAADPRHPRQRRSCSSTPWPSRTAATGRWTGSTAT